MQFAAQRGGGFWLLATGFWLPSSEFWMGWLGWLGWLEGWAVVSDCSDYTVASLVSCQSKCLLLN